MISKTTKNFFKTKLTKSYKINSKQPVLKSNNVYRSIDKKRSRSSDIWSRAPPAFSPGPASAMSPSTPSAIWASTRDYIRATQFCRKWVNMLYNLKQVSAKDYDRNTSSLWHNTIKRITVRICQLSLVLDGWHFWQLVLIFLICVVTH